jgi:FKBP-type peptidyl-prolyl cis-trans isomerase 2
MIKEKDFVEINFTGRLKSTGQVFDTTDSEIAKENNLGEGNFKPLIICVGQGHLIKGLENWIKGKEKGKYTKIEITSDNAYGKKDAKLIRMIPSQQFIKHGIKPEPGLQINIDNILGTIRTVTGGRCIVDFNHPLAGKDLEYDIEIIRIVEEKKEQIESLLKLLANLDSKITIKDNKAEIKLSIDVPEEFLNQLKEKIKELTGIEAEFLFEAKKKEESDNKEKEEDTREIKKEDKDQKIKENQNKEKEEGMTETKNEDKEEKIKENQNKEKEEGMTETKNEDKDQKIKENQNKEKEEDTKENKK